MKPDAPATVVLIAGVARDGAIGRDNQLLWHLPEDLKRFKALTLGHPVIMGRKTWNSLPPKFRPLPGRRNLVLSRSAGLAMDGAEVFPSLQAALAACEGTVYVIGGAQIYAEALPRATRLELTEVEAEYVDADAFFPAWPRDQFRQTARESAVSADGLAYHFTTYERL
ncbi:dihydrofolate reductase [Burkholderiaceae bacterium UC74_6]